MNKSAKVVRKRESGNSARRDLRVRRTSRALTNALVALVLEKRYDAITVQDLLDRAGVGRSTFYSHYRGKDDLLVKSFELMLEMMDGFLEPGGNRVAPVRELFQHIGGSRHFHQALGRAHKLDRLLHVAVDRLSLTIERRLQAGGAANGEIPLGVQAHALAGAVTALLRWWIETNSTLTPDQMDRMFHALTMDRPASQR